MYRSCRLPVALGILLSACLPAFAGEVTDGRLSLDGFGTLGAVYNDSDEAAFVRDITQPEGAGEGWSGKVDSRLGLQATFRLNDDWTAIGQVVSRLTAEDDFDPELTWAFLRYSPDPAFQLRLGRVGLDSYMLADSKDVGYSYLWVRPPVEYYGHRHFSFIDGADFTFTRPLGNGLAWAKVYGGTARSDTATRSVDDALVEMEAVGDIFGGHVNYAIGPWQFQLSHSWLDYELEAPASYVESLRQIAVFMPRLADALALWLEPVEMTLSSAGLAYADGPLQLQAMFNHMDQEIEEGRTDAAFVTAGYRLGKFTPFLTWSESRTEGAAYRDMGLPIDGSFGMSQSTVGMGLRFDVADKAALKAQFDRVDVEQSGLLWREAPLGWQGDVSLFSVSLDFVF